MKHDLTAGLAAERDRWKAEAERLRAENERLRLTLGFYASWKVWFSDTPDVASYADSDKGQRARAALTPETPHA